MKKLLLILLCLPMIGFGQNNFKNKNKSTSSSKYLAKEDYELLSTSKNKYTSLKKLVENLEKYGFELQAKNGKTFRYKNIYGSPFLRFYKKKFANSCVKKVWIVTENPDSLLIWKVESQWLSLGSTLRKLETKKNKFNDNQKSFFPNDDYELIGSKVLYSYNYDWCDMQKFPFIDFKIYRNTLEDEILDEFKENQIAIGYASNYATCRQLNNEDWLVMYQVSENLGISEFLNEFESIASKLDQEGNIKTSNSIISIPFIKEGNMNFIYIKIGGKSYKYLVDTGASDLVINTEMKDYLMQVGVLKSSDFGQSRIYEIANGSKVRFKTATLNSIEISGNKFNNIPIAIGDNASLLLGMSFLDKFHWRINNNTLELERK